MDCEAIKPKFRRAVRRSQNKISNINEVNICICEYRSQMGLRKQTNRNLNEPQGEVKIRFISPSGEIFIDAGQ